MEAKTKRRQIFVSGVVGSGIATVDAAYLDGALRAHDGHECVGDPTRAGQVFDENPLDGPDTEVGRGVGAEPAADLAGRELELAPCERVLGFTVRVWRVIERVGFGDVVGLCAPECGRVLGRLGVTAIARRVEGLDDLVVEGDDLAGRRVRAGDPAAKLGVETSVDLVLHRVEDVEGECFAVDRPVHCVAAARDRLRPVGLERPPDRHLGQCVQVLPQGEVQHDESPVVSSGVGEHVAAGEMKSTAVVLAELILGSVAARNEVTDPDDGARGPGDDGRCGDAACAAVPTTVDLENPLPLLDLGAVTVEAIAVRVGLASLLEAHRRSCGQHLITDDDGERATRFRTAGVVDGHPDRIRTPLAEPDADAFTGCRIGFDRMPHGRFDGLRSIFDRRSVVVVGEDVFSEVTGLGPAERAVLAHSDAVTPSASDEAQGRLRALRARRSGERNGHASENAQNKKTAESIPEHPGPFTADRPPSGSVALGPV